MAITKNVPVNGLDKLNSSGQKAENGGSDNVQQQQALRSSDDAANPLKNQSNWTQSNPNMLGSQNLTYDESEDQFDDEELIKRELTAPKPTISRSPTKSTGDTIGSFLQDHVLFKGLDENFIELLASSMQTRIFADKDFVIRKGQVGRAMFFIRRGQVEAISEDGETILNVMTEGSFFGEIGLLFSVPRTASCRCNGRAIILILTKDKFTQTISKFPEANRAITLIAQERFASYCKQQEAEIEVDFGDELALGMTNDDLKNVPLFRDCEVGFLHMMAMSLTAIQYKRDALIIKQGDIAGEMYFVARGTAEIINEETGQIYGQFHPGSFFGEIGLLYSVRRTASVRCSSNIINVFKLNKSDLDSILEKFPEVAEKISKEAKLRLENDNQKKQIHLTSTQETNSDVDVVRERLKTVPLFQDGSIGFLHQLALSLRLKKIAKNEFMVKMDELGTSMYIILDGVAEVISEDGSTIFAELGNNAFFGEVALFFDIRRTASVRAREECTVFELSKASFQMVLNSHPAFAKILQAKAQENYDLFQSRQRAVTEIKSQLTQDVGAYDVDATAERIKSVPMFKNCDTNFLRELALNTSIHSYQKGALIIKKGDVAASMYFIVSGNIQIVEDGEHTKVYDEVGAGGFFGEIGLLKGVKRTASVIVSSETCDLIQLTAKSLDGVLKYDYNSYHAIISEASRRFELAEKRNPSAIQPCDVVPPVSPTKKSGGAFSNVKRRLSEINVFKRTTSQESITPTPVLPIEQNSSDSLSAAQSSNSIASPSSTVGSKEVLNSSTGTSPQKQTFGQKLKSITKWGSKDAIEDVPKSVTEKTNEKKQGHQRKSSSKRFSLNSKQSVSIASTSTTTTALSKVTPTIVYTREGKVSILSLDSNMIFLIGQHLKVKDRVCLRLVCRQWRDELVRKCHWKKLDFSTMSSLMNQQILKMFCETLGDSLYSLQLKNCFRITDTELKGISLTCRSVGELCLSNCWAITDRGLGYIARNLRMLNSLDISYCSQIIGVSFDDHQMIGLKKLDISFCKQIGDDELELVLSRTPELRDISLRRCKKISDFGLFTVIRYCRFISRMDLTDCDQISEKSLKWIASGCSKLTFLNITFCTKINPAGIFDINIGSQHLIHLKVDHCVQLTEAAILLLVTRATCLKYLSLRGCKKISDATIMKLGSIRPSLVELDATNSPVTENVRNLTHKGLNVIIDPQSSIKSLRNEVGKRPNRAEEVSLRQRFTNIPRAPVKPKKANKNKGNFGFD